MFHSLSTIWSPLDLMECIFKVARRLIPASILLCQVSHHQCVRYSKLECACVCVCERERETITLYFELASTRRYFCSLLVFLMLLLPALMAKERDNHYHDP